MNIYHPKPSGIKSAGAWLSLLLLVITLNACVQDDFRYLLKDDQIQMVDVMQKDSTLALTIQALERANLAQTLNTYGPYTFFAPDNQAWRKYFKQVNKNGLAAFTAEEIRIILQYHIIKSRKKTFDFQQGPISDSTVNGDYVVLDVSGGVLNSTMVNDKGRLYDTDIEVTNGVLHKIDAVLDPPVITIAEFLNQDPEYSMLVAGLKRAGLYDTLNTLTSLTPTGRKLKTKLTLFAESNAVLQAANVDLTTMPLAELTALMKYHILPSGNFSSQYVTYAMAYAPLNIVQTTATNLGTLLRNEYVYFDLDPAFKPLNKSVEFLPKGSDIIMKNGVVHKVNKHMRVAPGQPRVQLIYEFENNVPIPYGISPSAITASSGNYRLFGPETTNTGTGRSTKFFFWEPDSKDDSLVFLVPGVQQGKYKIEISFKGGTRGTNQLKMGKDLVGGALSYGGSPTYEQKKLIATHNFQTGGTKRFNFITTVASGNRQTAFDIMVLTPVD
jgi:uncharacterized surface protein with fasciclin (FAS1) repeats